MSGAPTSDFTAPVGPGTYVEVLAPVRPGHPVARWLGRVGGSSGWVLSTQVPSLPTGSTGPAREASCATP